jgi:glycine C-acetyltransferase
LIIQHADFGREYDVTGEECSEVAYTSIRPWLLEELRSIRSSGLYKAEKQIAGPQNAEIETDEGGSINFCANNYLGLANHPEIIEAAAEGLKTHGYGMASVRFICGTQDIHRNLEKRLSEFLQMDDTILYTSCFDANGGLFETLLQAEDAIISDGLNHASIIDGIRLSRAQRHIYKHGDMVDLESRLSESAEARFRLIVTDGVFSMQGDLAPLDTICDLAEKHDALVMVDDSHATGFMGPTGRGTPEHFEVEDRVDIVTSTLGKALGGASGGFTSARQEIVDFLRQRSRPYLFSNTLAPPIVSASLKALELTQRSPDLREKLMQNTRQFRDGMTSLGFRIARGIHPIVPIMLGDEQRTVEMAGQMFQQGIYVVGFSYPVVPRGEARIRVQLSAAHSREQIDRALNTFEQVGKRLGIISS